MRGYWDTWNVSAGDVDAELEEYITDSFRITLRGRIYAQTGAIFWSDDYTGGEGPKGQYWTGDRELSPFVSYMGGLRLIYTAHPEKRVLGLISGFRAGLSGDVIQYVYSDFTLAGTPIGNARSWIFGLNASVLF